MDKYYYERVGVWGGVGMWATWSRGWDVYEVCLREGRHKKQYGMSFVELVSLHLLEKSFFSFLRNLFS